MYHKDVFNLKNLNFLFLIGFPFCSVWANDQIHKELLNGSWQCVQAFNLTEDIHFRASFTSIYVLEKNETFYSGTITTTSLQKPEVKSVLKVDTKSDFHITDKQITYLPSNIEAAVLENGLGELTEDFVTGFKNHKVETKATIVLLNQTELELEYLSGTNAKCLRK